MLAIGDVILRAFNFVFLVIALGLTGSLAATTITQHNPQINFAVFAAAFGLLTSSFYGFCLLRCSICLASDFVCV